MQPLDQARDRVENPRVVVDGLDDVRAQDLHRHLAPVRQLGEVHLRDRRARHAGQVEGAEDLRVGLAVGALERLDHLLRGEGRDRVLQLRELVGDVGGDEVRADGHELPELHEDGAQLLEGDAQAHAARTGPVGPEVGDAEGEPHERAAAPDDEFVEAVATDRGKNSEEPEEPHGRRFYLPPA